MEIEVSDEKATAYANEIMGELHEQNKSDKFWLVQTVQNIVNTVEEDLNMSQFKFKDSTKAAEWNSQVLEKHDYDFVKAVENENNTILTPGAEFRKIWSIKQVWKFRNNWEKIESILKNGCIYPLKEKRTETIRQQDLKAMVERGNHKSALTPDHVAVLEKNSHSP